MGAFGPRSPLFSRKWGFGSLSGVGGIPSLGVLQLVGGIAILAEMLTLWEVAPPW